MKIIHTLIGILIMLIFRAFPNLPEVTDIGMSMLGVFVGTLYLWIMTDTLSASLISVVMVVFTRYMPVGDNFKGLHEYNPNPDAFYYDCCTCNDIA